ncbi:MAG: TraG family conjugative transposon ATPase [Chitinophagaceae bacterium]
MKPTLTEQFPILGVDHNSLLSWKGDFTLAFKATLPELFTLSGQDYENLHHSWVRAIKTLGDQGVFHKQDWFLENNFHSRLGSSNLEFLSWCNERFFHERPYLDHHCYIFLTQLPPGRKSVNSRSSNLLHPTLIPKESLSPMQVEDFQSRAGQFKQILEDTALIRLSPLTEQELTGTPQTFGVLENYCYLAHPEEPPLIRDLVLETGLRIGDRYGQLFTLAEGEMLPALCGPRINYDKYSTDQGGFSIGFAASLGALLPCNHIYNQYLFTGDPKLRIRQLERKRLRLQSLSAYSRNNATSRDAIGDFLQEAASQQRLPIQAHFNLLVWTTDPHRQQELKSLAATALGQMDALPKQEITGAPQIFWAGIPGNAGDLPQNECFDSFVEQAACLLNLESGYRSSASPFGIRLGDRISGRPMQVDLSDEPMQKGVCSNRNKFILGPSGSGKSFFTNHLVRSYYEQGTHIVLVDVGHSYRGLCELVGGYYFTYDHEHPLCFNPFYLSAGRMVDTEKKESIKTLLLALWKKDTEGFRRSEYVALSQALQGYFDHLQQDPGCFPGFNSFYDYLQTRFVADLEGQQVREKDFDVSNFLYVLRPFYRGGEFDYLLNATEHLDLISERFIVFELDQIKDHPILFPVVTLTIMEVFISKMRGLKGVRKMILIEEAWKAISREGMAEYIKYLFKTVRKFFGEAVVVTQEVEDIIHSPVIRQTIINNADCKILLDQGKYLHKFQQVQELLGLTDKEKSLVLSLNKNNDPARKYKEVFISLGGQISKVYRTEVSPEEYLVYTTEETEQLKVRQYAQKMGGDLQQGISLLAREMRRQPHPEIQLSQPPSLQPIRESPYPSPHPKS